MKNYPGVVNQKAQNFRFGVVVKVSILFPILVLIPESVLACFGGGGGGSVKDKLEDLEKNNTDVPHPPFELDDPLIINLTGITNTVDRNLKTALNGWEPSEETRKEWKTWYENWKRENEKNKNATYGSGTGADGRGTGADDRGPGSGWPNLPGWSNLNEGNPGEAIPPWAYVPKNIGKPSICYLPPVRGTCYGSRNSKIIRYGFNPYTNECQTYEWSGCGGTRNRFVTKKKCEEICVRDPPPSCSADSGIPDKNMNLFEQLNL